MGLEMRLGVGRLGHEISGEYVSHKEAEKMFNAAVYGDGFLGKIRRTYDLIIRKLEKYYINS